MKKIALTIIGSLITLTAFADPQTNTDFSGAGLQTTAKPKLSLDLGWYSPSNSNLNYADNASKNFIVNNEYDPYYGFDFDYPIPEKDSEIGVDYYHYHSSNSSNATGDLTLRSGPAATWASGDYSLNVDQFDLYAGHKLGFGKYFDLDLSGGLEYGKVSRDLTINGMSDGTTLPSADVDDDFDGWGPEFGAAGTCHPFPERYPLSVYGGVNYAMLYGTREGTITNFTTNPSISEKVVVPHVSADLGVKYSFTKWIDLSLGYDFQSYLNVLKDADTQQTTDQSLQGPYFRASFNF